TVPEGAAAAVAFWAHGSESSPDGQTLSTLTLGGTSFPIVAQLPLDLALYLGVGVAYKNAGIPSPGTASLAWAWSGGGNRAYGGRIFVVWLDSAGELIDVGVDQRTEGAVPSVTIDSTTEL